MAKCKNEEAIIAKVTNYSNQTLPNRYILISNLLEEKAGKETEEGEAEIFLLGYG